MATTISTCFVTNCYFCVTSLMKTRKYVSPVRKSSVFCDLSMSFDCVVVNHSILLFKLPFYRLFPDVPTEGQNISLYQRCQSILLPWMWDPVFHRDPFWAHSKTDPCVAFFSFSFLHCLFAENKRTCFTWRKAKHRGNKCHASTSVSLCCAEICLAMDENRCK